ncbi:hypothetical protein BSQ98_24915 [Serratia liquefaciens]|nr:hypothetical protein BSQ98_24915 [Serratia liquefaciens]
MILRDIVSTYMTILITISLILISSEMSDLYLIFTGSYCEPDSMDCEPGRINASPLSRNVSRWSFSFAVNVSRNLR